MDRATGFRAALVLVTVIVVIALIIVYRNNKSTTTPPPSSKERFSTTGQSLLRTYPAEAYTNDPAAAAAAPSLASVSGRPTSLPLTPADKLAASACDSLRQGSADAATVLPAEPLSNEQYRAVDFATGDTSTANAYPSKRLGAEDLLPKDAANTKWAQVTPSGQGELRDLNFITAGWHIGVNTQGQSLRNANLQLRSDPILPQFKVSPWNMSTMEPDVSRRPFEIL